jgi:hypothetical protein
MLLGLCWSFIFNLGSVITSTGIFNSSAKIGAETSSFNVFKSLISTVSALCIFLPSSDSCIAPIVWLSNVSPSIPWPKTFIVAGVVSVTVSTVSTVDGSATCCALSSSKLVVLPASANLSCSPNRCNFYTF